MEKLRELKEKIEQFKKMMGPNKEESKKEETKQ